MLGGRLEYSVVGWEMGLVVMDHEGRSLECKEIEGTVGRGIGKGVGLGDGDRLGEWVGEGPSLSDAERKEAFSQVGLWEKNER